MNKHGFTLLEIIIVVIIIGVLASLALPSMANYIEVTRTTEAMMHLSSIRDSLERFYVQNGTYNPPCYSYGGSSDEIFACLGLSNFEKEPNAHFTYVLTALGPNTFYLYATRNTYENGDPANFVVLYYSGYGFIERCGVAQYIGVGKCPAVLPI